MKNLFLFILLFISNCVFSQDFIVKHFTTTEGLNNNIVYDASWDNFGYIWITTSDHMIRFDGNTFKKFKDDENKNNKFAFHTPLIKKGTKYIFSNYGGELFEINLNHEIQKIKFKYKKISFNPTFKLYDFSLMLPESFQKNKLVDSILSICKMKNEPIVLNDSIIYFNNKKYILEINIKSNQLKVICASHQDAKLCKIDKSIFLFKKSSNSLYLISFKNNKTYISLKPLKFSNNNIFIKQIFWRNGMDYSIATDSVNIYLIENNLKLLKIAKIPNDYNSIINIKYNKNTKECLISSNGEGLYLISNSSFNCVNNKLMTNQYDYYSHAEYKKGKIIGTGYANYYINDTFFESIKNNHDFRTAEKINDSITCFHNRNNTIEIYNSKTNKFHTVFDFNTNEKFSSIFISNENKIYNFSFLGVIEFNENNTKKIIDFKHISYNHFVRSVVKGQNTDEFIIGGANGLYSLNFKNYKVQKLSIKESFDITWLTWYENKLIICTYGNGVWVWDRNVFAKIPNDKNNNLENTYSIFIDSNKMAWFSTSSALVKTSINNIFENNAVINSPYISAELYDKTNKFDIVELNGTVQGSQIVLSNGKLSLAGLMGFMQVDMYGNAKKTDSNFIHIDEIKDNENNNYPIISNSIVFPNCMKSIVFEISSPTSNITHGQLIYYRFKNKHANWEVLDLEKTNQLVFQNLPSGHYVLEFKKVDNNNGLIFTFQFEYNVEVPWYFKWWAILGWLLDLGILFYIILRIRTKHLKKSNELLQQKVHEQAGDIEIKNNELEEKVVKLETYQEELESNYAIKNKLIGIITHDLITPLQYINSTSLAIMQEDLPSSTFQQIKAISDSTQTMYNMTSELIEWIKSSTQLKFTKENLHLKNEIDSIVAKIEPFFRNKSIKIKNDLSNDTILHCQKAFHILFFQLIMNAAKYSEDGTIRITSSNHSSLQYTISIADEGIGMLESFHCMNSNKIPIPTNYLSHANGFGLFIINDMLAIMKATISIQNNSPKGSIISVTIPL